jgi:hypothetical protein
MTKLFMTTAVAGVLLAGTAFAQDTTVPTPVLSGEVSLDFAETTNNNYGGTMSLDLGVDLAGAGTVDLDFEATDGNALTLDTWAVGTTVGGVGLAMGDDLGVMPGAEGEQTLAAPAMTEALRVTVGDAQVAVGFTDWTTDVTDVSNIQGAYTVNQGAFAITAAGDYNMDTENTVLGGSVGTTMNDMALTGVVTYDVDAESFGYEGVVGAMGVTAYLNGDDTDALQNVGGEYEINVNGATFTAGANYNIDTEDFAPTAGISFAF